MAMACTSAVTSPAVAIGSSPLSAPTSQLPIRRGVLSSSFLTQHSLGSRHAMLRGFLPSTRSHEAPTRVGQLQVMAAKRSRFNQGGRGAGGMAQPPGPPPIDLGSDGNPKFILFVRATGGVIPEWFPLSVIDGGTQAQGMISQMKSDFGRKIFQNTLTRNIAGAVYKGDPKDVIKAAVRQYPILKDAKGYEFAYKIADPEKPRESMMGAGVTRIPPKEELTNVVDKIKGLFSNPFGGAASGSSS